ncbi:MAG TPA: hypothetical protein VK473_05345 [Terriglobales bacterium]|nr:hypothetical protein [Terriglobales bacterium]
MLGRDPMQSSAQWPLKDDELTIQREFDLSPPETLSRPLWRSLVVNARDRFFPEKLAPLELTSHPVDVGMLLGDYLALPWYRTVFTSLGDVINPDTSPPMELQSKPIDVGELIADQLSHGWWSSLLHNLADSVAPERTPPLHLTSTPVNPGLTSGMLLLPRWSSLISAPKIFLPDKPKPTYTVTSPIATNFQPAPVRVARTISAEEKKLKQSLLRSRLRQGMLVAAAVVEAVYLLYFGLR